MIAPDPFPAPVAAIVFDLDGTLVDSAADLAPSLDATLEHYGRNPVGMAAARAMIGDGIAALVERGFAAAGGVAPPLADAVTLFRSIYQARIAVATRPYPHVVATLEQLAERPIALAVCTNKPRAATDALLAALDLARFFAAVVGGDEGPRKPAPWPVEEAVRRLRVDRARAVMIGDSHHDMTAARAAGLSAIAVRYGYGDAANPKWGARSAIDRFDQILPALGLTELR
jgi:phosphoglycolate phosphatase